MNKAEILRVIEDEARQFQWSLEQALKNLREIGFSVEKVEGNRLFSEAKIRESVQWAYYAQE